MWFWHQIVSSSFSCDKFYISMLSHIFHSFSKTELLINLKKSFSKSFFAFFLRSVFISIYGFSQEFWLNWISLWTFFNTNLWFNACFKFLCVYHIWFYHINYLQAFRLFKISFFQIKSVNHYDVIVFFQDNEHWHQWNILHDFPHYKFFMKNFH